MSFQVIPRKLKGAVANLRTLIPLDLPSSLLLCHNDIIFLLLLLLLLLLLWLPSLLAFWSLASFSSFVSPSLQVFRRFPVFSGLVFGILVFSIIFRPLLVIPGISHAGFGNNPCQRLIKF